MRFPKFLLILYPFFGFSVTQNTTEAERKAIHRSFITMAEKHFDKNPTLAPKKNGCWDALKRWCKIATDAEELVNAFGPSLYEENEKLLAWFHETSLFLKNAKCPEKRSKECLDPIQELLKNNQKRIMAYELLVMKFKKISDKKEEEESESFMQGLRKIFFEDFRVWICAVVQKKNA